jgi:hypothetical protein
MANNLKTKVAEAISCDQLTRKKDGTFVAYRSYFYAGGYNSTKFAELIISQLIKAGMNAIEISSDDRFVDFRGGASIKQGSHWSVHFKVIAGKIG